MCSVEPVVNYGGRQRIATVACSVVALLLLTVGVNICKRVRPRSKSPQLIPSNR